MYTSQPMGILSRQQNKQLKENKQAEISFQLYYPFLVIHKMLNNF